MGRIVRQVIEGVADGFVPVGLAAPAEGGAEEGDLVAVLELELSERVVVGRAGDDDGGDVVACVEEFDGALEDRSAAQVLVEFVAGREDGVGVGFVEPGGRPGGGDDDGDAGLGGHMRR